MSENAPKKAPPAPEDIDSLDVLSSIWILSCNDENPIITYKGLEDRLNVPLTTIKEIVQKRRELFRPGVSNRRLKEWKGNMLNDTLSRKHVPSYIRIKETEDERRKEVVAITMNDVFRNQFRTEEEAPKPELDVLKWGLEHIDRIRKARTEAREERIKRWSSIRLPLFSTIIAFTAIMSSCFTQFQSIRFQQESVRHQEKLKYYEIEIKPIQEAYASVTGAIQDLRGSISQGTISQGNGDKIDASFASIFKNYRTAELYLGENGKSIGGKLMEMLALCQSYIIFNKMSKDSFNDQFDQYMIELNALFRQSIQERKNSTGDGY